MRIWRELVDVARWAPSSHNAQPWRLRVLSELQAELCFEPSCLLPASDPEGTLTTLALGAFTESLSIAGAPRGFEVRAALRGEPPWETAGPPVSFARLVVAQRREPEQLAPSLIGSRRTSRLPFDGVPIDDAVPAALAAAASGGGHRLGFSSSAAVVEPVLELYADTLLARSETDALREETAGWLRSSEREAARDGAGLSPACLGPAGPRLRRLFGLSILAALPGARDRTRAAVRESLAGTATVAWLHGPAATLDEGFRAGRTLCRVWLTSAAHGLHLQPLTIDPAGLPEALLDGGAPWLVFRIGRGAAPPRAPRRPKDAILFE